MRKILSKSVDIVKVDRARSISEKKRENIFYSKTCKNIGKLRTFFSEIPFTFLKRILKKIEQKEEKNSAEKKKKFFSAKLYSLS